MSKKAKIAIVTPFLANGGLEKVAIVGAEELSKYFDVTLIVMDSFHIDYPYSGIMIDMKVSLMNRGIFKRFYNILVSTVKLRNLKQKYKFDLVISHGELANIPNVFSGGKKNILVVHGNRFAEAAMSDRQSRFVSKMIKYIYFSKNIAKVVTVSEGIRESFIQNIGMNDEDIVSIYNPFNIEEIKNKSKEELGVFSSVFEKQVLIISARLTIQKGHKYLLRIFKELKKKNKELKLIVLGDGDMRENLIELSKELGLKTYSIWDTVDVDNNYDVFFLGFQKNPFKFVKASKLFVMTSLWEGFGNTIVESMVCGTPVISTDCKSGPREILGSELKTAKILDEPCYDSFGVLMPAFSNKFRGDTESLDNNEQLWADTVHSLLNNDKKLREYINSGFERAESFNLEIIILEWIALINSLTDELSAESRYM